MTIEILLIAGAVVGLLLALLIRTNGAGCISLGVIPLVMIVVVVVGQWLHPESIRSTSALDFVFAPLWPSVGGFTGYAVGWLIRSIRDDKNKNS